MLPAAIRAAVLVRPVAAAALAAAGRRPQRALRPPGASKTLEASRKRSLLV